jgi:hypothetical protein
MTDVKIRSRPPVDKGKTKAWTQRQMGLCCTLYVRASTRLKMAAIDGMALLDRLEPDTEDYEIVLSWVSFLVFEGEKVVHYVDEALNNFRAIEADLNARL